MTSSYILCGVYYLPEELRAQKRSKPTPVLVTWYLAICWVWGLGLAGENDGGDLRNKVVYCTHPPLACWPAPRAKQRPSAAVLHIGLV